MDVAEFLRQQDVAFEFIPHQNTYDAQRLAETLHVSGRDVAKTVLLRASGAYVVAILPADRSIDLESAARVLNTDQVELATEIEIAERCPDCEIGALPPFGSQYKMSTLVDESLASEDEIVFEGNNHHEAYRIRFADFRRLENPLVGDFARA